MSRHGDYEDWFGGELRQFRLAIGQLRKLQEAVNAGPVFLMQKIIKQEWWVDDLREVLKWGLIGGGMKPNDAGKLLALYFDEEPHGNYCGICVNIIAAAVYGPEDEQLPKKQGEGAEQQPLNEENSRSPVSTPGAPSSPDTPEPMSTTTAYGNSSPSSPDGSRPTSPP